MTPSRMLRPVLVCLTLSGVGLTTASCGMVEGDPHRFENLAQQVADISLDGSQNSPAPATRTRMAADDGLRPAVARTDAAATGLRPALRVEVMDPHDLWDARDGLKPDGLARTLREQTAVAAAAAAAAAPVVTTTMVQRVSNRVSASHVAEAEAEGLRPAISRTQPTRTASRTVIQLGAYSSDAAARAAWTRVSAGAARQALNGLSPVFERATVNGRALTRLKVAAPTAAAVTICRAAQVSDPWCARRA
jgi:hypothetical protein